MNERIFGVTTLEIQFMPSLIGLDDGSCQFGYLSIELPDQVAMTRSTPPSSAYDEDFYTWTRDQAAALRRSADRLLEDVDVEHLADEIEDLGKRDLREVKSFLRLLIGHLLKIESNPAAPSVPHWRIEARAFNRSAATAFSPGMRQSIDMPEIWQKTLRDLDRDSKDIALQRPTSGPCPFQLDDLLSEVFDVDVALTTMAARRKS